MGFVEGVSDVLDRLNQVSGYTLLPFLDDSLQSPPLKARPGATAKRPDGTRSETRWLPDRAVTPQYNDSRRSKVTAAGA